MLQLIEGGGSVNLYGLGFTVNNEEFGVSGDGPQNRNPQNLKPPTPKVLITIANAIQSHLFGEHASKHHEVCSVRGLIP